jgi:hypothetical protein
MTVVNIQLKTFLAQAIELELLKIGYFYINVSLDKKRLLDN